MGAKSGITLGPVGRERGADLLILASKSRRVRQERVFSLSKYVEMRAKLLSIEDARLLRSALQNSQTAASNCSLPQRALRQSLPIWSSFRAQSRFATTKSTKKIRELQQGAIRADPLPEQEADDAPQYPTVLQGARNNMIKFGNCVLLTRVGSFYEV